MRRTPEGKVKDAVKKVLDRYVPRVYSHWPVLNGMGKPTLDCNGAANGHAFAIETKAPGERPTARQVKTRREMEAAGIVVFVIDEVEAFALTEFEAWIKEKLR